MQRNLLNISKRVNLALHALGYIGAYGRNTSAKRMAKDLPVSETYLSKVLQQLVKAGYIRSKRGAGGGHVLAKDPQNISAYEIVLLMEGPFSPDSCLFAHSYCSEKDGVFHETANKVRKLMERSLRKITVARIMKNLQGRIG
ncbi:MAG TPA: Rrf2 family transcriptional regulator [bacterium]|nr:Rrf2 family transcriptional regulator [bacterium]